MRKLLTITGLFFLFSCSNQTNQNTNSQLAGMYKLLYIEVPDASGMYHEEDWAKDGESYILYDGKGHMMVQIIPKGYHDFTWMKEEDAINAAEVKAKTGSMSMDELKAAVNEFASCYSSC